mmetsp:Transcript_53438/g.121842  ORF Transcript_53438/g.121842 Transcript_53438/m.121842 type:complete len:162 (+) Transcript_53438:68-553(+)
MAEEVDERAVVPVFPPFRVGDVVEARLRGKHHWYPATVCDVEVEGLEMHEWRYTIQYTDGYRDLHYPPPPPPLAERNVEPKYMRDVGEHHALTAVYDQGGSAAGPGTGRMKAGGRGAPGGTARPWRRCSARPGPSTRTSRTGRASPAPTEGSATSSWKTTA